ncbi:MULTISPECIES: hypothetical protein [unclassified Bradyrhizobium]|uniref:hypothetical protein n=1 Tax=unclassified Bradyrhizobium TaxID=2631580 RepID=UPI0014083353|nr:hypothetical protein [Bradyrhizobium sp. 2S1]MCK7666573.1 hypothetical protein [Bradyrhizobium sp. 2S1]
MLTAFVFLVLVALAGLSARWAYQAGYRDGREQGLTDSYRLYGVKGLGPEGKPRNKEPEKVGA